MENTLAHLAVSLALAGKWSDAQKANLEILKNNSEDLDALNRLARCYFELMQTQKAISTTKKVLELDPNNIIAQKCISKWKDTSRSKSTPSEQISAESFLEESGKTKIIPLLNIGDKNAISNLNSGDELKISAYAHKVSITDSHNKYLGRIPDDSGARLKNLLKQGAKFQVLVKSVGSAGLSVFIREVENNTGTTSFPPEKIDYVSFTPPELVHKDSVDIVPVQEDE